MTQPTHDRVDLTLAEHITLMRYEMDDMRDAIAAVMQVMSAAAEHLVAWAITANEVFVTRYAVMRLDVPESDIRSIKDGTVRLWNGRRIPIDPDTYAAWLDALEPA